MLPCRALSQSLNVLCPTTCVVFEWCQEEKEKEGNEREEIQQRGKEEKIDEGKEEREEKRNILKCAIDVWHRVHSYSDRNALGCLLEKKKRVQLRACACVWFGRGEVCSTLLFLIVRAHSRHNLQT